MNRIITTRDAVLQTLASWEGANGQLWLYSPTFRRLAIRLFRDGGLDDAYVVAVGCKHWSGPFDWVGFSLYVAEAVSYRPSLCLLDRERRLEMHCDDIFVVLRPRGQPPSMFDDFVDDAPA